MFLSVQKNRTSFENIIYKSCEDIRLTVKICTLVGADRLGPSTMTSPWTSRLHGIPINTPSRYVFTSDIDGDDGVHGST